MTVDLVPLSDFSARHARGWRIVPGYDLKAGDYAATMMSPDHKLFDLNNKAKAKRVRPRKADRQTDGEE